MNQSPTHEYNPILPSKKCHECYTYIPLEARVCPSCKTRIGKIDSHGMAAPVTNWKANIICILAWLVFGIFVKYAFF